MKKILLLLLASIIFIAGCGGDDNEDNNDSNENGQTEENNENANENEEEEETEESEQKDLYQIGETASGESSAHGFPYEVTVNEFEVTTEYDGKEIGEFYSEGFEPSENARMAVVNITLHNTGEEAFNPDRQMTPYLTGDVTSESAQIGTFPESEEDLEPGSEITGDLVFIGSGIVDEDVLYITFNINDPELEFSFELPAP